MTYAQFLAFFLLPPILILAVLLRRHWKRRYGWSLLLVCVLAYLYTSPWDNHAARIKLWTFDPHFAPPSHFLFYLPWEEYAFYGLQGILVCLVCVGLTRILKPRDGGEL